MTELVVIMSVYKNDKLKFLKESVQSILDQTFDQFHFFIVLDGPVAADIDNYLSSLKDIRIKLFKLEKNEGLAKALNYLLDIVLKNPDYKLIARMDADDISITSRFEVQKNFLMANPSIFCVGSWYHEIDEYENILSSQQLPVSHEDIKKFFMRRSPIAHPSVMFRREMIEIAGLYPIDTIRLEDYAYWSNAIKNGILFSNIPEYLLLFRRDKDFYKRRSGIKFGINYIHERFKINKVLKVPVYIYFYSFFIGIIRMMPSFVIYCIYKVARKYF
jgi:glycosyltransferase involved in cell wall biosynthesis